MLDKNLLVLVPTYKEVQNVAPISERILSLECGPDLLFIDDNSPDGTGELLDRLAAAEPRIHVVHREGRLGIGSAHVAGLRWAGERGFRMVVTMDCDFTHSPQDIPRLISRSDYCNLVVGSRHAERGGMEGWRFHRRFLTNAAHVATRTLLGMPFDATASFRLYRLDGLPLNLLDMVVSKGYSFFLESLYVFWSSGVSIGEVPVTLLVRSQGHSKMRLSDAWQSLKTLLRLSYRRLGLAR
jgi:dolichol-phosphate mannosyltransferase